MTPDIKEIIHNKDVHGFTNDQGHRSLSKYKFLT